MVLYFLCIRVPTCSQVAHVDHVDHIDHIPKSLNNSSCIVLNTAIYMCYVCMWLNIYVSKCTLVLLKKIPMDVMKQIMKVRIWCMVKRGHFYFVFILIKKQILTQSAAPLRCKMQVVSPFLIDHEVNKITRSKR